MRTSLQVLASNSEKSDEHRVYFMPFVANVFYRIFDYNTHFNNYIYIYINLVIFLFYK